MKFPLAGRYQKLGRIQYVSYDTIGQTDGCKKEADKLASWLHSNVCGAFYQQLLKKMKELSE